MRFAAITRCWREAASFEGVHLLPPNASVWRPSCRRTAVDELYKQAIKRSLGYRLGGDTGPGAGPSAFGHVGNGMFGYAEPQRQFAVAFLPTPPARRPTPGPASSRLSRPSCSEAGASRGLGTLTRFDAFRQNRKQQCGCAKSNRLGPAAPTGAKRKSDASVDPLRYLKRDLLRNAYAQCSSRLAVDCQLGGERLLNGKIGRLCAVQQDIRGRPTTLSDEVFTE